MPNLCRSTKSYSYHVQELWIIIPKTSLDDIISANTINRPHLSHYTERRIYLPLKSSPIKTISGKPSYILSHLCTPAASGLLTLANCMDSYKA